MIKKITYEDKVSIQNDESVAVVHKVTDTDMNEVKEVVNNNADELISLQADNTTNKSDISNIKSEQTSQNEYISQLEAENARLREDLNGLPKGQASGESIDLSDSAEMRCDLKISGNSRQETREGYNKLKPNEKVTSYGLTGTPSEDKLTISGTSTTNPNYLVSLYTVKISEIDKTQKYKLSFNNSTTMSYIGYRLRSYNGTTKEQIKSEQLSSVNFKTEIDLSNISDDVTQLELDIISYATTNTNISVTLYPMIYKGTEEKTFEPYGASPSPDYPSEVESCGDNVNLFDKNNPSIENNKDKFHGNGNSGASEGYTFLLLESIKQNTKYSFDGITTAIIFDFFNGNNYISTTTVKTSNGVITTPANCTKMYVSFIYADKDKLKIVEGKSTGEYSPYGQGSINEVICNKNLWNINYSGTNRAITYNLSKNKITLNGTSNGLGDVFNTKNYSTFFLKAGTYTINAKVISGSFTAETNDMALYFKKKSDDKNFVSLYKGLNYTAKGTITFTEDDEVYVYSFVNGSNVIFNNLVIEIQMEEGSTETDCVEHQEQVFTIPTQQPFRAIEDTRDTFINKNNKWYERHYVSRKIFDGTESFAIKSQTEKYIIFEINQTGKARGFTNIICSHFKTLNSTTEECVRGSTGSSYVYINISKGRLSSIDSDGFKEWLTTQYNAGTPVYVDYVLEESLDIECTEEQSTILFDIEQNAKTYDKVTHMYSTDKISSYKEVTYKKDIETLITNIEQAILSQGGNI